jgi:hypothetical protein
MMKRVLFVLVFVPVHWVLTIVSFQRLLNYNPIVDVGLWPKVVNVCAVVLSLPVLFPLILLNPDGGRFPGWFEVLSVPLNSIVWAVLILLLIVGIKRFRASQQDKETPNHALAGKAERPPVKAVDPAATRRDRPGSRAL